MDAGNGWMYSTRRDRDAELFADDLDRWGGRRATRTQTRVALALAAAIPVGWGLWSVLAG